MGSPSSSELLASMIKPFSLSSGIKTKTAQEAASDKGFFSGVDDVTAETTIASLWKGMVETQQGSDTFEEEGSPNKIARAHYIRQTGKAPSVIATTQPPIDRLGQLLALEGIKTINPAA